MGEPEKNVIVGYNELRQLVSTKLVNQETTLFRLASLCEDVSHSTIARFASGQAELTGPKITQLAQAVGVRVQMPDKD